MVKTGVGSIFVTTVVAATIASAPLITYPAYARSGPGSGPGGPGYSATQAPYANVSGGYHFGNASSAQQFSSSGAREGWHSGSIPPGWTGHGEKRGWDNGRMPPGLSNRDRDPHWHDRKFDRRDEKWDRERGEFRAGQFQQRWGW